MAKNIKTRKDDYAQWYLDVIKAAQLADYSPVKGMMVIRPEGFAIWEAIQRDLDRRFKETGHVNAYFPLLIPQSFLAKEAKHVEGFAMECALVTHTRLQKKPDGDGIQVDPSSKLEEPLVIRPTSETIIGHMYHEWIQSYRDLPVLINQWCNVMRWEMRTRLFLRTAEFLWQEGHTAHETAEEAQAETLKMLGVYRDFMEQILAVPVVMGAKTESEKFPGADTTYCVEALMQDGKALQAGTSHNLGQNFAKAFDIQYLGRDQKKAFCHTTSWGVSTRMIGMMIMAHSDDEGLVLPPNVAPIAAAIVPIFKTDEEKQQVKAFIDQLTSRLIDVDSGPAYARPTEPGKTSSAETDPAAANSIAHYFFNRYTHQRLLVDWRDARPGDKQYHWEQRGVPFRIEVGPRDVAQGVFVLKNRLNREKETVQLTDVSAQWLRDKLSAMQQALFERARKFRDENIREAGSYDEMKKILETHGGFVRCYFEPSVENEAKIKAETKATVRCIPFDQPATGGKDIITGNEVFTQVLFAQSY
jgi:prolyl-tRNA synthetase